VPELLANLANWKADNPAEAYRISLRNLRIGVNRHGRKKAQPEEPQRLPRTPKGKAAKLHKSRASRDASKRRWAAMSEDEKAVVAARIAGSVKARHAAKTPEERAAHEEQLAAARQRIDHNVRKARQKEALAAYWTPERRKAFGDKVRARRQAESTK
jgi:hypothetical protein